jgi:tRNA (adenine57-N1/adenine58-N1)-methyltransferase
VSAVKPLADGEVVVFIDARGRRHVKRLRAGHRITIRSAVIAASSLIGAPEGVLVGGGQSEAFRVFRPLYADLAAVIERPAEPVFPKDAGLILMRAGVCAGAHIVEAGVGAGTLTIALLAAVGPHGSVTSYELRADFAEAAERSVAAYYGPAPQWRVVVRDAASGFDEREVDAVVADVPDPDALLGSAAEALRAGGTYAVYVPTILQVKQMYDALDGRSDFAPAETFEVLERAWRSSGRSLRPEQRMIGHTGFLMFARRTAEPFGKEKS